jgi:hypothetical protein
VGVWVVSLIFLAQSVAAGGADAVVQSA